MTALAECVANDELQSVINFEVTGFSIRMGVTGVKFWLRFKKAGEVVTDSDELEKIYKSFTEANRKKFESGYADLHRRRQMTHAYLYGR